MRRSSSAAIATVACLLLSPIAVVAPARADSPAWVELAASSAVALDSQSLATDGTGQHLLATNWTHGLRVSADFGTTWLTLPGSTGGDAPPLTGWGYTRAADDGSAAYVARYVSGVASLSRLTVSGWTDLVTPAHGSVWYFDTSATGAVVVGTDDGYGLIKSTDSGATWTAIAGSPVAVDGWGGVSVSGDGSHIAAISVAGVVSTSPDGGVTWTSHNVLPTMPVGGWWVNLTMSDSGRNLVTTYGTSPITGNRAYTSTDGGATWRNVASVEGLNVTAVDASNSGGRITIATNGVSGHLFTSLDAGGTWSQLAAPTASWQGVAVSGDGTHMYAQIQNGSVYSLTLTPEGASAPARPTARKVKFPRSGSATLAWSVASDHGSPVLRYDYCLAKCTKSASWRSNGLRTSLTVRHLIKRHRYTVRVRAVNAVGRSAVRTITFTQGK